MANANLSAAKAAKNDEFYTQLSEIRDELNGPTVPSNLQMLCHSCNLDKANKPFDKAVEEQRLQTLYAMTDAEIAALPEAEMN